MPRQGYPLDSSPNAFSSPTLIKRLIVSKRYKPTVSTVCQSQSSRFERYFCKTVRADRFALKFKTHCKTGCQTIEFVAVEQAVPTCEMPTRAAARRREPTWWYWRTVADAARRPDRCDQLSPSLGMAFWA